MAYGPHDLVLTADLPFTKIIAPPANKAWAGTSPRLQVRHPIYKDLLIELTAMLDIVGTDLVLSIPADATAKMPTEGIWDVLVQGADPFRTPTGRLLTLMGVTRPL